MEREALETMEVVTRDGRRLAVDEEGDLQGQAVFLLHGTPGSRVGPAPPAAELKRLRVRLITFDRPGYGKSDKQSGRSVASVAADVTVIADALQIETFTVVGRSGGAPHALACGALLPDRVRRVAALSGLAPLDATGLNWFHGMIESNVLEFTIAREGRPAVAARLGAAAEQIRADPASKVHGLILEATEADRQTVSNPRIRDMLVNNFAEGLRETGDGWVDDIVAFCSDWGFDPRQIEVPTLIWHGEKDVFSPVSHAQWLARNIPGATLRVEPEVAHFGAIDVLPKVLLWLTSPRSSATRGRAREDQTSSSRPSTRTPKLSASTGTLSSTPWYIPK